MKKQLLLGTILSAILLFAGCNPDEPNPNPEPEPEPENKSPYVTRVFEYKPAPGQFVNKLPKYETGDTPEKMAKKVLDAIGGDNKGTITLGGFMIRGGGFDH